MHTSSMTSESRLNGLTGFQIQQHVQCLSVVRHLLIQSGQIEFVLDIVLVHLKYE